MSSAHFLPGLTHAADLFAAAHLSTQAGPDPLEKQAGFVAAVLQRFGKQKEKGEPPAPAEKTASRMFPVTGRGAAIGAGLGALLGGLHEVVKLRGLVGSGAEAVAARNAARTLHTAATAKAAANPKYIRSSAEHAAGRHVDFLKQHDALTTPGIKAPGALKSSPGLRAPSLMAQAKLYAPHVGRKALGWGAGGAALGHGAEMLVKHKKQQHVIGAAKKWALPALGGLVGAKILLDRN